MSSQLPITAGVDEAGRGPLAGPVVAAAVILDPNRLPVGLDDSKKLTAAKREALFTQIMATSVVSFAFAPPARIERDNIRAATLWAMGRAVRNLAITPDLALIDGRDVPEGLCCDGQAIIGGDGSEACIGAASIIAKVMRDRLMRHLGELHPVYRFEKHMGYGTAQHLSALQSHGICVHHRRGFAPVRACLMPAEPARISQPA